MLRCSSGISLRSMKCTLERQQNLHRHKSYPGHSPNVDPWYVQFTEANRCRGRTDWSWLSKTWLDRFFIVLHKCWLNPKWLKFLVICWLKYVKILALHRHQCFFSAKGPPDTEMQCDAAPEDWEMRRSARTWGRSTLVDDKRWLSSSIRLVTSLCVPLGKCIHHIMIYYEILWYIMSNEFMTNLASFAFCWSWSDYVRFIWPPFTSIYKQQNRKCYKNPSTSSWPRNAQQTIHRLPIVIPSGSYTRFDPSPVFTGCN